MIIIFSVVGLNFDFIALNLLGFILYSMFNVGLWIPEIEVILVIKVLISFYLPVLYFMITQKDYSARNPRGLNPVQLNDIFFSIHAVFATIITVAQCFFYEVILSSFDLLKLLV